VKIEEVLTRYKTIAVVGCSKNEEKHAHKVPKYMKEMGYTIIPVNPTADEILGEKCYKSLLEIPEGLAKTIEIVDIFRPSDEVGKIVDEAIELRKKYGKPEVIWMQLGIINEEAAEKAKSAGFNVIMNRCLKIEHERIFHHEGFDLG